MGSNLAPGIEIIEKSFSQRIESNSATVFATLGMFSKGPVNEPYRITSPDQLREVFGKPNDDNYMYFLPIATILEQSPVDVVRVEDDSVKVSSITFGISGGEKVILTTPIDTKAFPLTYDSVFSYDEDNKIQIDLTGVSNSLTFSAVGPGKLYDNTQVAVINRTDFLHLRQLQVELSEATTPMEVTIIGQNTYNNAISGTNQLASELARELIDINNDYVIDSSLLDAYLNSEVGPSSSDEFLIYEFENNNVVNQFLVSTIVDKKDRFSKIMFANRVVSENSNNLRVLVSGSKTSTSGITVSSFPRTNLRGSTITSTNISNLENELYYQLNQNFSNKEETNITAFVDLDFPLSIKRRMDYLASLRKDCIAILNVPADRMINLYTEQKKPNATSLTINYVKNDLNINSSYSAIYANYFKVYDSFNDEERWIPCTGHIANRMAFVYNNFEPWRAFAGLETGVISGVSKVAYNPSEDQIKGLYPARINAVVKFRGEGVLIWGNKTLQSFASSTDRINVRNLLIYIGTNVAQYTRSIIFKQNDAFTRAQWRSVIGPFINSILQRRGIEEYRIVCDESNNPIEVVSRNELQAFILIRPTPTAEFVKVTIADVGGNLTIDEVLSGVQL
jgi:hypothetical protein